MAKFQLNKNSPEPLYKQLASHLIEYFNANFSTNENKRLPTEREIAEMFNVSRITVRQSLKILEDQNIIEREQGKGTFLRENKSSQAIIESCNFSQIVNKNGKIPSAKLLSLALQLVDTVDQELLQLPEDTYVIAIKRIWYIDEIPCSYEISHFTQEYSFLLNQTFNNVSLYDYIFKEKGIRFVKAKQTVEIVYADNEIAKYLQIQENSPLLLIQRVLKDQNGKVNHLSYEYLVADKFKFQI